MKGKLLIATIALVITALISALFFAYTPAEILKKINISNSITSSTSITIRTRNGIADVEIDGKDYGQTPVDLKDLPQGQHEVTLTRVEQSESGFYKPIKLLVDLYPNTEAVIDLEIGPSGNSGGYLLYYSPSPENTDKNGYLSLSTTQENSEISLDQAFFAKAPIEVRPVEDGEHKLKVNRTGYEGIEFPIVIRNGYNLNVNIYLLPVPVALD